MKFEANQIQNRGRENDRSKFRKIFAALASRDCGFSVAEIARYSGVGSSSVSRMLEPGRTIRGYDRGFIHLLVLTFQCISDAGVFPVALERGSTLLVWVCLSAQRCAARKSGAPLYCAPIMASMFD